MKKIICVMALSGLSLAGFAQTDSITPLRILNEDNTKVKADYIPVTQYWKEHNIFQHLDLSLTAGTTGIGFDVASPVTEWAQVRAGYEFMPRFSKRMIFDLTIGGRPARSYDADGNRQETTFDRMSEFLYQFTGYDVDDHRWMCSPSSKTDIGTLQRVSIGDHHSLPMLRMLLSRQCRLSL